MERQINSVRQKCFWTVGNMWKINPYLDYQVKIILVKKLILSRVDYCNALYMNLPKKLIKKLVSLLNACIRFIHNVKNHSDDLIPLYKRAHILPVEQRIKYKICLLCYKSIRGLCPTYMSSMLAIDTNCNDRPGTRNRPTDDNLQLMAHTRPLSRIGNRRFSNFAPVVWNSLPYEIRSIESIVSFKKKLKTFYFASLDLLWYLCYWFLLSVWNQLEHHWQS